MGFRDADKAVLEARVVAFEQATGAQVVVSVVDRCDGYPEAPWRAFALGTAIAALLLWFVPVSGALLHHSTVLLLVGVLGAGVAAALLVVFLPVTGRWLLPVQRCEAEVRQYAQALFLTRELFATRERTAILILVSQYERRAVVIADRGLHERLAVGQLKAMEARLNALLGASGVSTAVQEALAALQAALQRPHGAVSANEIADDVIHERGA